MGSEKTVGTVIDLFAGPGGWDVGARCIGIDPVGIEWDDNACATRRAAGLLTIQGDVAAQDPLTAIEFTPVPVVGLIASPPCQSFSMAGKRAGEQDTAHVIACAVALSEGRDVRDLYAKGCADPRSMLVVEPIRWVHELRPRWIALEQVPPVLGLWEHFGTIFEAWGYRTWTGILSAERYGVPQTRKRAILMASLDFQPQPPEPTHQAYVPGEPQRHDVSMLGEVLPWVSMAQALGWDQGLSVQHRRGGDRLEEEWSADRPSDAVTGRVDRWQLRAGTNANDVERPVATPAPTLRFSERMNDVSWVTERPSTTVNGDPRIFEPGWRGAPEDYAEDGTYTGKRAGDNAIRVSQREASILQGFPPDYPWQGTRSQQFQQIGNAVPPPLARAVLTQLVGEQSQEMAA